MGQSILFPYYDDYFDTIGSSYPLVDFINAATDINKRIADQRSKDIFVNRMMYSLTGDYANLSRIIKDTKYGSQFLKELMKRDGGIYVYGAGVRGKRIVQIFPEVNWLGYIDRNVTGTCNGLTVRGLEQIPNPATAEILISNQFQHEEIRKSLLDAGAAEEHIISMAQYDARFEEQQYFEEFMMHGKPTEGAFVDVGCFDGKTTENYLKKECSGEADEKREVFAFEPEMQNFQRCKKLLDRYSNVSLFPYAVSDDNRKTSISSDGIRSQVSGRGGQEVSAVSLDKFIGNKKIGFLKVDVEGAEKDVLAGAENIIRCQKPKCAVCVYHKRQDIWTIPQMLLKFNPGYRFYFRHYSVGVMDTVLYAVNDDCQYM